MKVKQQMCVHFVGGSFLIAMVVFLLCFIASKKRTRFPKDDCPYCGNNSLKFLLLYHEGLTKQYNETVRKRLDIEGMSIKDIRYPNGMDVNTPLGEYWDCVDDITEKMFTNMDTNSVFCETLQAIKHGTSQIDVQKERKQLRAEFNRASKPRAIPKERP